MAKKTTTKTRRINPSRKVPNRPMDFNAPAAAAKSDVTEVRHEWQVINVPAPPGVYAGVDYDGNGLIFRRVDTHYGINQVVTHLESLLGEPIAASSIAQYIGPLPEFGDNPQFQMFTKIKIPANGKEG